MVLVLLLLLLLVLLVVVLGVERCWRALERCHAPVSRGCWVEREGGRWWVSERPHG
eukprot:COSAG02_NODE_14796_length_1235_cov_1.504401_2_plen_56_part_00